MQSPTFLTCWEDCHLNGPIRPSIWIYKHFLPCPQIYSVFPLLLTVSQKLTLPGSKYTYRAEGMAQEVDSQPSKQEALSSNPSASKLNQQCSPQGQYHSSFSLDSHMLN
jgi:hypothetical protein